MPYMDGSKRHGNMADERAVYQLMDVNFSARSLHEANARQDRKLFTGSRATTNPSVTSVCARLTIDLTPNFSQHHQQT